MLFKVPGPCEVLFGVTGTPPSWGTTKAGITIRSAVSWVPIIIDESGGEPVDYIFGGRTMTVEIIGLDTNLIKLSMMAGTALWQARTNAAPDDVAIGQITGEATTGQELWIRESVNAGGGIWKAHIAEPQDPAELVLRATQELMIPVTFLIVPDSLGKLFFEMPSYIAAA